MTAAVFSTAITETDSALCATDELTWPIPCFRVRKMKECIKVTEFISQTDDAHFPPRSNNVNFPQQTSSPLLCCQPSKQHS